MENTTPTTRPTTMDEVRCRFAAPPGFADAMQQRVDLKEAEALLEGYDHTEIAEILKVSESNSKSQYMVARRKIKEILKARLNEN